MKHRLAIDFGTTNTVIAHEANQQVNILTLPDLSEPGYETIPSLLYIRDGISEQSVAGYAVKQEKLDRDQSNRLFRNFKRGIVTAPAPPPRLIDGTYWSDEDAGSLFFRHLLAALPYHADDIDQLVLTAPVAAFEGYLAWLTEVMEQQLPDLARIRLVDESTAAALGYAVTEPGAVVLVFDFGGGTLDLSLVQLPESKEKTGSFLGRFHAPTAQTARVIAKVGRVLGGSDIDQWLLAEVLHRVDLTPEALGIDYAAALTACEQAKIALSSEDMVSLNFTVSGQDYTISLTRSDLESVLEHNGFYAALRHSLDKAMATARQQGIFQEDIHYVLMVGGVSLMPSVQAALNRYFTETAIRADRPFTAVVEGALLVAQGCGLDDYLSHSYGLRYLSAGSDQHQYDELIPMGTRYPTETSVELLLGTAHPHQAAVEFVIGEIATDAVSMIEVSYEDGQVVFVAQADQSQQQIIPLNAETPPLAYLVPNGKPDQKRLKALFSVDERRQLRLTVTDLKTREQLLNNVVVATLR